MKRVLFFLLIAVAGHAYGQHEIEAGQTDSLSGEYRVREKSAVKTISVEVGLNMVMRGFNRFILNDEYAQINLSSMKKNLSTLPVWDTNKFSTNLIAHPYHGSMYFNSSRINGYNFYQSIPFTFGGSLMWEYLMETKPPSVNDLVSTTIGGTALGEITFRLSDLVLDSRTTGVERIGRELIGGVLSPIRFLNRLTTRELWTRKPVKGNYLQPSPFNLEFYVGEKDIDDIKNDKTIRRMTLGMMTEYGEITGESIENPYDWFRISGEVNVGESNFYLSQVNGIGAIFNKGLYEANEVSVSGGIFQHFNYYNLKTQTKDKDIFTPYYISEAASLGPGLVLQKRKQDVRMQTALFASGIGLGASISDYFEIDDRDYNMGSGFSLKLNTEVRIVEKYTIKLFSENYIIYTWKGIDEEIELKDLSMSQIDFLNVQGDRSTAKLHVFGASISYEINDKIHLIFKNRFFTRNTSYKYFPPVHYKSNEIFVGMGWYV